MFGYIVDIEFTWGFQACVPAQSKTSPSFYYPPPTTFLGAIAEAIAKRNSIGEREGRRIISSLSKNLCAIGLRPLNCQPIKYEDISKIIAIKITSRVICPDPRSLKRSMDSPARGRTIMVSLDDEPPRIRFFTVWREPLIKIGEIEVDVTAEDFWRIHRIGSKEGVVSTVDIIEAKEIEVIKDNNVKTSYTFPLVNNGTKLIYAWGRWVSEVYINPFNVQEYDMKMNPFTGYVLGENLTVYIIPILTQILNPPRYDLKISGKISAYKLEEEVIIGID